MINYSKEIGKVVTITVALAMMAPVGLTYTGNDIIRADFPPTVIVNTPGPEEQIYNRTILIDWIATDVEDTDSTLDITIQYSLNGGTSWFGIMSGVDNNNPPYAWDTVAAGATDSVNYFLKITAIDNAGQYGSNTSYIFSIDNTPDDRWYLQVESVNLGTHLDLDMKPSESTIQEISIEVPSSGDVPVQSFASEFVAQRDMDLVGDWKFSIYAKVCSSTANGSLYANVYADDGLSSRLLFTTIFDDEALRNHFTYHEFSWTHSVPPGTLIQNGEHVVMEIMLNATTDPGPPTTYYHYANADNPVLGTIGGNFTQTIVSDDQREVIDEVIGSNGTMVTILYEDFTGYSHNFPPGWTVVDGGEGNAPGLSWSLRNPNKRLAVLPIAEPFAIVDTGRPGDPGGGNPLMDEQLITPVFNFTFATSVTLEFDQWLHTSEPREISVVDVRSSLTGGFWQTVLNQTDQTSPNPDHQNIDITTWAAGAQNVDIRFYLWNGIKSHRWVLDNIHVKASLVNMSLLKHIWTFDIPPFEEPYQFLVEAGRPPSLDFDNFTFAYSTDNVHFTDMVTIDSQVENNLTYDLPPNLMGTVYIRVVDTDRSSNMGVISSVEIDRMFISSIADSSPNLHNNYANADIPVYHRYPVGDYRRTFISDDQYQVLQEIFYTDGIMITIIDEDFFEGIPSWWNVVNGGGGGGSGSKWTTANPGNRDAQLPITAPFAIVDALEHGNNMDEQLVTPVIEMDDATSVFLEFDQFLNHSGNSEYASVDVRSSNTGGSWQNVYYRNQTTPDPDHQNINITAWAAGALDVEVRFHYFAPVSGYWWMVDNVKLWGQTSSSLLEHKWTIDVPINEAPYTFSFEGLCGNGALDDFRFAYSTDDIFYTNMFTVDNKLEKTLTYPLPSNISGTVFIRVVDVNRFTNLGPTAIEIDQMFIRSVSTPKLTIGFDHYTTPSYIEPAIPPNPIAHLCIQDAPGGNGTNVTTHSMTTDETFTVWAIGYDSDWNYISDIQANWTNTLNAQTATSTTIFTFDPAAPGSGTITAVLNATISDTTGLINVTAGLLDNIVIRDSPGGLGNVVTSHSMTIDDTLIVWAAGYDAEGNYISDINCDWSTNETLDLRNAIDVNNFGFDPSSAGTSGYINAVNGTFLDSAGLITVGTGGLDHIVIRYASGGGGSEVGDVLMVLGETLTVYSAGYDSGNNYIGDIPCNWTTTGTLNLTTSMSSTSFTFKPAVGGETGFINSTFNSTLYDLTGIINVTGFGLDYIVIEDGLGNEVMTHTMDTTETFTVWAIGYNLSVGEIGPVNANWTTTGTLDLQTAMISQSFTFDPVHAPTTGTIEALLGALWDSTGTITVNLGPLTYLCIQDAPGGTGMNVTTHMMSWEETLTVWSIGFDAEWNYIDDVNCNWSTNETLDPQSDFGVDNFTFDPSTAGTSGYIIAINGTLSDSAGLITVGTGAVDRIIIRFSPGGEGSEVGDVLMVLGETLTVYSAGYDANNNYIEDIPCNWTTTGTLNLTTSMSSTSFTFEPAAAGETGTINATFNSTISDETGTISVTDTGIDFIVIVDDVGTPINNHWMDTTETLRVWSMGWNISTGPVAPLPADWTTTGTLDLQTATNSPSFTFDPVHAPTIGSIEASYMTYWDSVPSVIVDPGPLAYLCIQDAPGDTGTNVTTHTMTTGETFTVWAIGYDEEWNYISNINCDWTTTGTLNLTTATSSPSFTFKPAVGGETGTINATFNSTISDETGMITVIDPGIDYIRIEDGLGNEILSHTMDTTETFTVWAIGYNSSAGEVGPVNANWTTTPTLDLQTAITSQSFTFDPIHAPTLGLIIAEFGLEWDQAGPITVNLGPLTYLCIQDTPGGTGTNVTTHMMTTEETFTVWSIGYDAEWNYINNINCDWTTTGTLDLQTAMGINTFTFSPINPGAGTIAADFNATISDETGLITVIEPIPTFDIDITPAAGSNGWILISFPNQVEGNPLTIIADSVDEGAGLVTWDIVQWYDPTSPSGNEWKTTATFKPPQLNTFNYVNNTYSFWIHITNYGDGNLTIQGAFAAPGEWASIELIAGWNLVGYPHPTAQVMTGTFGILINLDMPVETYDPADPYRLRTVDISTEDHEPGHGYWVHVAADEILTIQCP